MENYELGDLPEPLRAWAKFRPADSLDFSRRAKSLATALKLPLQKTQDVYAIACGYSGRHELQQVLKHDGMPGPYDDVIHGDLVDGVEDPHCLVQFYRHARLLSALRVLTCNLPGRYFQHSDKIACDLGLFSSPAMHLRAVKAATSFLSGEPGYSPEGFPFGYRGMLHRHYLFPENIDEVSLSTLVKGWVALNDNDNDNEPLFDPRRQNRALLSCRAPHIFKTMVEETAAGFLSAPPELALNEDLVFNNGGTEAEKWLLTDMDWVIAHLLCERAKWEHGDQEFERVLAAIRSPDREAVSTSSIASAIANFDEKIAAWRLSVRYQLAELICQGRSLDWEPEASVRIIDSVRHIDADVHWLSICLQEVTEELSISRWRMWATLLTGPSNDGPWYASAFLAGDYVVASRTNRYDSAKIVMQHFDECGEDNLSQAWKLLSELYLPVAGFLSYHEWVNELFDGGGAIAVVTPWVAPALRGTETSSHLIQELVGTFDDGIAYVSDSTWRGLLDIRENDDDLGFDGEEEPFVVPGALFIPLPGSGMLGYSVWGDGEEATTKVLRLNGGRIARHLRGARGDLHGGLGPHLLQVAKTASIDVVLFDPHSRESDSEDT